MKLKEVLDATNISFRKKEEELKKFQDNQYIRYKNSLLEIQATRNECLSEMNNIREKLVLEYQALLDNKDKEKNSEILNNNSIIFKNITKKMVIIFLIIYFIIFILNFHLFL